MLPFRSARRTPARSPHDTASMVTNVTAMLAIVNSETALSPIRNNSSVTTAGTLNPNTCADPTTRQRSTAVPYTCWDTDLNEQRDQLRHSRRLCQALRRL